MWQKDRLHCQPPMPNMPARFEILKVRVIRASRSWDHSTVLLCSVLKWPQALIKFLLLDVVMWTQIHTDWIRVIGKLKKNIYEKYLRRAQVLWLWMLKAVIVLNEIAARWQVRHCLLNLLCEKTVAVVREVRERPMLQSLLESWSLRKRNFCRL
jgi:hypothetical protein